MLKKFYGASGIMYYFRTSIVSNIRNCVYMYAACDRLNKNFTILYIGYTTQSLRIRNRQHYNDGILNCILSNGYNLFLIYKPLIATREVLKNIESDLLRNYTTKCNIKEN